MADCLSARGGAIFLFPIYFDFLVFREKSVRFFIKRTADSPRRTDGPHKKIPPYGRIPFYFVSPSDAAFFFFFVRHQMNP